MQLSDYANVLRRHWWVLLLTAAIAAVAAYGFSKIQQRLYRSEATYLVVPNRNDNGLSIVLQNNMNSYKTMALAPIQLQKISEQLKLDHSADWLLKHVAIQPRLEDRVMIVQVDYPDPPIAERLANAIGDNMVALVSSLNSSIEGTDKINMRVTQPARPAYLYRPQTRINVAAGGILGLILGLLLAFLLEALDNSLKTPADVERFVGLTTLGAIPTAVEHGIVKTPRRRRPSLIPGKPSA
jgi:capsular polysaccharide biosynthesis protein